LLYAGREGALTGWLKPVALEHFQQLRSRRRDRLCENYSPFEL
jgi:hypothetical protein